jgi:hypothetical protein
MLVGSSSTGDDEHPCQVPPTELVQQTGRRRERRPEPIAHRDEFDPACLVQRDQVLEVNLAHTANAKRAKSQPFAIHVKDSIGQLRMNIR